MSLKIQVNTFNRLKKIRKGIVYESIETVLDELLQNCQRAFKSGIVDDPIIDLVIGEDYLILRDNGIGCDDPQSVLEFETSAWDEEDVPNAFGQGGSESIFQIADYFEISSLDWKISVDVLHILETGDLDITPPEKVTFYQGYEIMIKGEKIAAGIKQINSYLKGTVKHYPYSCFINGEKIDYVPLQKARSEFTETLENKFYSATLGIQNGYTDTEIFFEKRKVTDEWIRGVVGIIELKDDAVDLKSPDRKSIIHNNKYYEFKRQLVEDAKFLYLSFITKADCELYEKYVDNIDEYLKPEDYIDYLPEYLGNVLYARQEKLTTEVDVKEALNDLAETTKSFNNQISKFKMGAFSSGGMTLGGIKINDNVNVKSSVKKQIVTFKDSLKGAINYAWVEKSKQEQYIEIIRTLENHEIKVLISKNKLYDKAFRLLKIPHVLDISNRTESRWLVGGTNQYAVSLDIQYPQKRSRDKEQRLLEVLKHVEKYYDLDDVFRIADVKERILIQDEERTIIDTTSKATFAPVKDRGKIYLDRDSLNLNKLTVDKSTAAITKFDILVILLNVNTIANGLANIIYNSINGTVAHYRYVEKISKEIAMLLASF